MQEFVKRAKEYIETLDTEDPNYDFISTSLEAIHHCRLRCENSSQFTDAELSRMANLITIAKHVERCATHVEHIMEEE